MAGSTVGRATLHNEEEIQRKDIRIGDTVVIEKAGEIIPAVVKVVLEDRPPKTKAFKLSKVCPECGSNAAKDEGEVVWRCPNPDCPAQVRGRLEHWCMRGAMDVDGGGEVLVRQLVANGLALDAGELYELTVEHVAGLERNGGEVGSKFYRRIGEEQVARLVAGGFWLGHFTRGGGCGEGAMPAL